MKLTRDDKVKVLDFGLAKAFADNASLGSMDPRETEVYGYRGEVDRAFEWLEQAYAQRDSGLSQIEGQPFFK